MEDEGKRKRHFILVHGACHGGWSWYKLTTLLTSAGHPVSAIDLTASGVDQNKLNEVGTFVKYSEPLMELMASLPPEEKVILVGHSFGGLSLALAMDKFPNKVSAAVFLTAFMPDSSSRPSYVLDKYFERTPLEAFKDTQFTLIQGPENSTISSMLFGPKFLAENLYQNSPSEDLTLAKTLVRLSSLFMEELANEPTFSKERFGSVKRVYIVCNEDLAIPEDFQHWMIENYPVEEVKEIKGADHMPMLSKPQEVCKCLLDIAATYS